MSNAPEWFTAALAAEVGAVHEVTITDLHEQAASGGETTSPPDRLPATGPLVVSCTEGDGLRALYADEGAVVVYDAKTLEEVRRLPMRKPSGKYNVWNKITFSDGTSH